MPCACRHRSRANLTVAHPDGTTTLFNEPGEPMTHENVTALVSALMATLPGASWLLVPVSGRTATAGTTNGAITTGAVVALKLGAGAVPAFEIGWTSANLTTPATPVIVNGVQSPDEVAAEHDETAETDDEMQAVAEEATAA